MRVLQRIPLKRILSRQVSNRKQLHKQQMCFTQRGPLWLSLKTSFCLSLCLHHRLATTNSCNKGVVYARVTPTLKSEGWLSLKGWSQQRRTTIKTIDLDLGNGQIAGRASGQRPIYAITQLWIQLQTTAKQWPLWKTGKLRTAAMQWPILYWSNQMRWLMHRPWANLSQRDQSLVVRLPSKGPVSHEDGKDQMATSFRRRKSPSA